MRRFIVKLSATALIATGAVAALQAGASASPLMVPHLPVGAPSAAGSSPADPVLSLTTTMLSYTPVNVTPGALAAGDGYVIAGMVSGPGGTGGLSTAQCTFTDTKGPVLRVCTVDYALGNGLIVTSGYANGPGKEAPVTLVIDGGTGAYAGAHGYGLLQPDATGSHVTLHLTH
jgi:hypothetical protein